MAKSFAEVIAWYRSPELRSWKRKLQFTELIFIASLVILSAVAVVMEEGRKPLENLFFLFAGSYLVSILMLGNFILRDESVSRYVRSFVIFGFLSGAGGLGGFGLLILTAMRSGAG